MRASKQAGLHGEMCLGWGLWHLYEGVRGGQWAPLGGAQVPAGPSRQCTRCYSGRCQTLTAPRIVACDVQATPPATPICGAPPSVWTRKRGTQWAFTAATTPGAPGRELRVVRSDPWEVLPGRLHLQEHLRPGCEGVESFPACALSPGMWSVAPGFCRQ